MKNLAALFIVSIVLASFPVFASANTNLTTETASFAIETESNVNAAACCSSVHVDGNSYNTHSIWLNRGVACVSISGNGNSDLDLFVYDGYGNRTASAGGGDDERVCMTIFQSGYFRVDVVNAGVYANHYSIWVS